MCVQNLTKKTGPLAVSKDFLFEWLRQQNLNDIIKAVFGNVIFKIKIIKKSPKRLTLEISFKTKKPKQGRVK